MAHGAVDLDHLGRVGARLLVQLVDVLGDERVQLALALQGDEGAVPGVGLGRPGRRLQAVAPRPLPDLGVGHVIGERGHLLGPGVLGPDALGAPEVGDARVGGDTGAGKHDHPPGLGEQGPGPVQRLHAGEATP